MCSWPISLDGGGGGEMIAGELFDPPPVCSSFEPLLTLSNTVTP